MKILLIMPNFFDYPGNIIRELNDIGYEVDYYDDRPSTNAWVKAIIRVNRNMIHYYIKSYFEKIMSEIKGKKYDIVFIISGQSLSFSEKMMTQLKDNQSQAKFILYQWDSHKNFPKIKEFQKYFDKCYSFDKNDVNATDKLEFLPLFYNSNYEEIGKKINNKYKYDFCFVGTAHPKKYKFIKMMSKQLSVVYPNQFIYFYFPSPIVYIYRKMMNKEFRKARVNEFNFTPLNSKKMSDIYTNSKCVLDSAQDGQLGLTIRAIESLGAKKKLITTNEDIVNYDFYCPENIYIYKGEINVDDLFFSSEYKELNNEVYKKYSLKNWLLEILK